MHPLTQQLQRARKALGPVSVALGLAGALAGCATDGQSGHAKSAPAAPSAPASTAKPGAGQDLFDGKTLKGWTATDFAGKGEVRVENGQIILDMGSMTGVTWTSSIPKMNYELTLEAMRMEGSDFFCGLTFPVGDDPCSFIVGGWGGGTVGLSSIDSEDASSNETTKYMNFPNGKWFAIRLRVTPGKIQAWIGEDKMVDVDTTGRKLDIRLEVELSRPLGIATWNTKAALRNIRIRPL